MNECEECEGDGYVIRQEDFCNCDPEFGVCSNSFTCEECKGTGEIEEVKE